MKYKCDKCGKHFRSNPAHHSKICQGIDVRFPNTNPQENAVLCVFCCRSYITMTGLCVHYRNNHEPSDYETICMECNRMCADVEELAAHKASAHPKLECPICKQILRTKETLKIHISNHSQRNRPFSCDVRLSKSVKLPFSFNYFFYRSAKQRLIGQPILKRITDECTPNIALSSVHNVINALLSDMS